jgi:hypothetical protein
MVYSIGSVDPYATTTGTRIIDGDYDCVTKMRFLHPEEVDVVSKLEGQIQMTRGYAVDPATAPKRICWRSANRELPDFISCASVMVVSEKVREIIEKHDPGAHQLLPVDVYRPKADEPFACYYWLVVCNLIDSVDEASTTYTWFGEKAGYRGAWSGEGDQSRRLVFNEAQIGARHLWRDPFLLGLYCTDTLLKAWQDAGVSGLGYHHWDSV